MQVCKVRLLAVFIIEKKLYAIFASFFIDSRVPGKRQLDRKSNKRYGVNYLFENATNISKYTFYIVHTELTIFSFKFFK